MDRYQLGRICIDYFVLPILCGDLTVYALELAAPIILPIFDMSVASPIFEIAHYIYGAASSVIANGLTSLAIFIIKLFR